MTIVLDTGALIALDRGSRTVLSRLQTAFDKGDEVQVPAGVIGQAWRQPNQHALLSRALKRCEEVALDGSIARSSGHLCGQTGTSDVIDASVAVAVADSNRRDSKVTLLTSDPGDMRNLLSALRSDARIVKV